MMGYDRRKFLKLSALGAAGLGVSGFALRWFAGGYELKDEIPIGLSKKELAIVRSLVEILLPEDGEFPSGISLQIPQRIDEEVWAANPGLRGDLKNAIQVLEHAPVFFGFPGRFSSLSPERREKCFSGFLIAQGSVGGTLRQIAVGLRQMVHFFYYAHPSLLKAIRHEGPLVGAPIPHETHVRYQAILKGERTS